MLPSFRQFFCCLGIGLYLCFMSCDQDIFAQATGDPKEDFLYGEFYLSQARYQKALPFYFSALEEHPDNANINYRIGLCYLRSIDVKESAVPFLEKAVRNIDMHYVEGRYKDPRAPVESWFLLGEAYHRENRLTEASWAYHQYQDLLGNGDKKEEDRVRERLVGLGTAYEYQRRQEELDLVNMGEMINSRFSDYNPVLSGDETTMVYTQFWESYDRILMAHHTKLGWQAPIEITDQTGSAGNCYSAALSYDGTQLYLICHEMENYDIYVTRFDGESWTKMEMLDGKINSHARETSMSVSADGNFLYFASDRAGGEGGFDIYLAKREGNSWGNVRNLGPPVNTEKDEEAPYISYDGTRLYFSSNGHPGVGRMDIFVSELDNAGQWTMPVNLGSPINTTDDDLFYIYYQDSGRGYLSRDLEEGFGKNDIYMIPSGNRLKYRKFTAGDVTSFVQTDKRMISTSVPSASLELVTDHDTLQFQTDSLPIYTIQIYALKNPVPAAYFELPLIVSPGEDGLYRYTFGEYRGWSKALEKLFDIRNSGYPDAFIRNINTVQHYQGKTNHE